MQLVRRSEFGWGATAAAYAKPTRGLVIHYDSADQGLAGKEHGACVDYWRRTRKFHMGASRGWNDIGYSFGACPHGYVFEGRGLDRVQAAQPSGNSTYYSVTLMSGPSEDPTPAQVNAVRELRQWLMSKGVGALVKGHRDFYATSCPGDRLYRLVKNGTFTKPATVSNQEDDMPSAKEIADAVYERFSHEVTADVWAAREGILAAGQRIDPRTAFRQIWAYSKDGYQRDREIIAHLVAQNAAIAAMAEALAARDDAVDVNALVGQVRKAIGDAIEGMTVRLDVGE